MFVPQFFVGSTSVVVDWELVATAEDAAVVIISKVVSESIARILAVTFQAASVHHLNVIGSHL